MSLNNKIEQFLAFINRIWHKSPTQEEVFASWKSFFEEFIKVLIVISAPAEKQIRFVGYGHVGLELHMDFEKYYTEVKESYVEYRLLNEEQVKELNVLEEVFEELDKLPDYYHDNENLHVHDGWVKIREHANRCREVLGIADWRLESNIENRRMPDSSTLQVINWKLIKNKRA